MRCDTLTICVALDIAVVGKFFEIFSYDVMSGQVSNLYLNGYAMHWATDARWEVSLAISTTLDFYFSLHHPTLKYLY